MKWYNTLALTLISGFIGYGVALEIRKPTQEATPTELAKIVREKGKHWGVNYTLSKELQDGTQVQVTFADINQNGCKERNDRLEIKVTPKYTKSKKYSNFILAFVYTNALNNKFENLVHLVYDDTSRHLPLGYEVTDWGCDGINIGNEDFPVGDDFRMYLGPDHWHHTHVGVQERDTRFEQVVQAGIKPMYQELMKGLVGELKK